MTSRRFGPMFDGVAFAIAIVASSSLLFMACDGGSDETVVAASDARPLAFESASQAYTWIAEEAARAHLADVEINRDGEGRVIGVTVGAGGRDQILAALHGRAGYFKVAGQRVELMGSSAAGAAGSEVGSGNTNGSNQVTSSALTSGIPSSGTWCNGGFCLSGNSYNTHIAIGGFGYHEIGGDTSGTITVTYNAYLYACDASRTDGYWDCNWGCVWVCPPQYFCNDGDGMTWYQDWNSGEVVYMCTHSYGQIDVGVTYFSNTQNCGSGVCQYAPVAVASDFGGTAWANYIQRALTAYGNAVGCSANGFGPGECRINGACSTHDGWGQGGSVLGQRTAAGSYDCF